MLKVRIDNDFQKYSNEELVELKEEAAYGGHYDPANPYCLKPYDEDEFRNERVYEFNTLKEIENFRQEALNSIDWTEEVRKSFSKWDWLIIDIGLQIDSSEDNLMILHISAHAEWRD